MIKKSHTFLLSYLLIFTLVLFSCIIQKRTFNRGYHIEWKTKLKEQIQHTSVNDVLVNSTKTASNSDSITKINIVQSDFETTSKNEVLSDEIKIQDVSETIFHKENDDSIEMYTYTYKKKTIIASKEEIQKINKQRVLKKTFTISGVLLFLTAILFAFLGLNSLESGVIILAVIFLILSIILLICAVTFSILLYETMKKMIIKHNSLIEKSSDESSTNSNESFEVYPTLEPNPKSKRNSRIFVILIFASIIGLIVFRNT